MKKKSISRILLLVLALLLIGVGALGAFAVTSSGLPFESEDYQAWFYMNHLQIRLIENGEEVSDVSTLDGAEKVTGQLAGYLGSDKDTLGSIEPGKVYKEEIAVRNAQETPVYVRMIIRKYWINTTTDEEGTVTAGEKTPVLSPDQIHLTYGTQPYNVGSWFIDEDEHTSESDTYYYRTQLMGGEDTEPLFTRLSIDGSLLSDTYMTTEESTKDGVTTITYTYDYDGYAFIIKADVQALQTHNANDAIHSQWGVYNVTESNGTLSIS